MNIINDLYKKRLILVILLLAGSTFLCAQPAIEYQNTVGSDENEDLLTPTCFMRTNDGGYIIAGYTTGDISGDKGENSVGSSDYWVVKLDDTLAVEWENTIGSTSWDGCYSVDQTSDGGYILGGHSYGDVSGDKQSASKGGVDYWIVKLDSDGNYEWDKSIGSEDDDRGYCVKQTSGGGYVISGQSRGDLSFDKSEGHLGSSIKDDYWIVLTDDTGKVMYDNTIGSGDDSDYECDVIWETSDGDFIIGGHSNSDAEDDKSENSLSGSFDLWIVKVNDTLGVEYENTIGSYNYPTYFSDLAVTPDGGCLVGGTSLSGTASGDQTEDNVGNRDYWIIKLDDELVIEWDSIIGSTGHEWLQSINPTSDGGFILGGYSSSNASGDKTENRVGQEDYWIVKIDSAGAIEWDKTIGSLGADYLYSVIETSDQGYALAGLSDGTASGDKDEARLVSGKDDFWILKLEGNTVPIKLLNFNVYAQQENILLEWSTATEENNEYFTIERSSDGDEFLSIGTVPGAGMSNILQKYRFLDINPLQGDNYYRLKQTDFNGEYTYSETRYLNMSDKEEVNVLSNVYFNDNVLHVSINNPGREPFALEILDASGKMVFAREYAGQEITPEITINDTGNIPDGIYFLRLISGEEMSQLRFSRAE